MNDAPVFFYDETATQYLSHRDPALGAHIARLGHISRTLTPEVYPALANAIVGQQISGAAQATVWARLCAAAGGCVTPHALAALPSEALRACGMSQRKAGYLHSAAQAFLNGTLQEETLRNADDDTVCRSLCALPGVGPWTAEMLLLFCFARQDVLSWGDFGIRRGLCLVHGKDTLCAQEFAHYRALYSPFGSVASFYLWEISAGR